MKQQYEFDQVLDRRGKGIKWDAPPYGADPAEMVPMWVADMDFATPDYVTGAIARRLAHPTFGYFELDSRFYDAVISWQSKRHGCTGLLPEMIRYQNSTVGGLVAAVRLLTEPGGPVLVNQPNYTGFTYGIKDAGRQMVLSPLKQDENGIFRMDLDDMEHKIAREGIHCAILCSPHNPSGRVWTQEELERFSALCEKYGVYVVADEIWSDFVFTPNRHIPTQQATAYLREHTIAFSAPTKSFNLAGLCISYSMVFGEELRARFHAFCKRDHYNVPNVLSAEALIGAYQNGHAYVDALLAYIRTNMELVSTTLARELPKAGVYLPEGTYTMWIDTHNLSGTDDEIIARLVKAGVVPNAAEDYNGTGHIRLNLACPRSQVQLALERMVQALQGL